MASDDDLVDAFMIASRALVAIAIASVADGPVEMTMVQHRALVLLAAHGEQTVGEVAAHLGLSASSATRHCDRLERMGLIARRRSTTDARVVRTRLMPAGRTAVEAVMNLRREEIRRLLAQADLRDRDAVTRALRSFADTAREPAELERAGLERFESAR